MRSCSEKIKKTGATVGNWCHGIYLREAVCDILSSNGAKNDIVKGIAKILDTSLEEVIGALIQCGLAVGYFGIVSDTVPKP